MEAKEQVAVRNSVGRLIFVAVSILIQISWILLLLLKLNEYSTIISLLSSFVALCVVLRLYGKRVNSAFKMPWIILILVLPVLGLSLYLLIGHSGATASLRRKFKVIDEALEGTLSQDPEVFQVLEEMDLAIANQSHYISNFSSYPIYRNTDVQYFSQAENGLEAQKEALRTAQHFIFMEYHAIEDSESFHSLKEILAERVQAGVEVRLIYDDVGSVGFINKDFIHRMAAEGIQCRVFNPLVPILNVCMNNRDHRKITVVDGIVGFTGGYNLADEYFNITHPYGHWKDTGIRLEGDAVRSLTVTFLELWNAIKHTDTDFSPYLPELNYQAQHDGFVQPYADSPLDDEYVGENVYLHIIKNAKKYVWFMTPYLIIDDEMHRELTLAAKRGVDVRIITPGIPDKKMIYSVTRSYYDGLASSGVHLFEYKPGFLHAKQCISDDDVATIGTINLDYRSLYLHFENAVFLYGSPCIKDIKADFMETFRISSDVTELYCSGKSPVLRLRYSLMRLIAPLL